MNLLVFLVTAVVVPMLVNELTDWLPWFAVRMIRAAARTLPVAVRSRYAEEWQSELDTVPGNLSKLIFAVRICVGARATTAAIGRIPRGRFHALCDKTMAAGALILLAPIFVAVPLVIRVGTRGPVFVRQTRTGRHGRPVRAWKFRTLADVAMAADAEGGMPIVADPQITKVGFWLRRWSLDGLPQLFNVLFGDLSLAELPARAEAARHDGRTEHTPGDRPNS